MKKWIKPEIAELNISDTANGFWDVNWEGPLNIIFGDYGDKSDNHNDSTPNTDSIS